MVPWASIGVALLGQFQLGVALVIVNTMMDDLVEDLEFDKSVGGGVAASALFLGAGVGSLVAGLIERIVCQYAQLCIGLLYAVGNLLCALSTDDKVCWGGAMDGCVPGMILAGRLIVGFGVGLALVISPRYLAAVSPAQIRGSIGACSEVSVSMGVLLGLLIGLPFEIDEFDAGYDWWRIMFFIATCSAILQCLLAVITLSSFKGALNETKKHREPDKNENSHELEMVEASRRDIEHRSKEIQDGAEKVRWTKTLSRCLENRYRRCVILGVGVPSVCELSGINIMSSYSTTIFEEAGVDIAVVGSILYGLGNVVSSAISAFIFDKFDRKTLANFSFLGMALSHLGLALSNLTSSSIAGPLSVVFVFAFIIFFGAGCGFLCTSYAPEVVPPEIADVVLGAGQSLAIFLSLFSLGVSFGA